MALGIVHYLLKPFTFRALADRLERYRDYRRQMVASGSAAGRSDIDRAFAALRVTDGATLPSGLSDATLESIAHTLMAGRPQSAGEIAASCTVSWMTARRYLEHLTSVGAVVRRHRHGGTGRPEIEYQWVRTSPSIR